MGGSDERRRQRREPLTLKVEYLGAGDFVGDYTENISSGGTFILTNRELEEGAEVRLVLSFPGLLKPLPLSGRVKWIRREPPAQRGVGIAFDRSDVEALAHVDQLVSRIAAGDPSLFLRTFRVLIVEDNPHVSTLVVDGLAGTSRRELGGRVIFDCETTTNGRDALARARARPVDILIADIYLPILDGADLIAQLRADAPAKRPTIIAISGGGTPAREAALGAGADHFIEKPLRLADIVAILRRLILA